MSQLYILLSVALGGAFGATSRYLISEWSTLMWGRGFPYGTLIVNVIGSLIMGFLLAAIAKGWVSTEPWRYILGVGFLGALTTFSTFSMDTVTLLHQGEVAKAITSTCLNVLLSIMAAYFGYVLISKV